MDHDAAMAREAQQQQLIEELRGSVYEEEGPRRLETLGPLIDLLLTELAELRGCDSGFHTRRRLENFFKETILPSIKNFSKSREETGKLLADLTLALTNSACSEFQQAYQMSAIKEFG